MLYIITTRTVKTEMCIINSLLKDCSFHKINKVLNIYSARWETVKYIKQMIIIVHFKEVEFLIMSQENLIKHNKTLNSPELIKYIMNVTLMPKLQH